MPQPDPGAGQVFGIRLTGFLACFARRTYYLLALPRWERRLRAFDWTLCLPFPPDIVELKVEPLQAELEAGRAPKRVGAGREAADTAEEKSAAQSN